MKQRRFATASWMLVPILLAAPAVLSGLSLWFNWGPQWPAFSIVLAGACLALVLDFRRALRFGFFGAWVGLATCPVLLLLLDHPVPYIFVTWIASAIVVPALLIPLLVNPAERSGAEQRASSTAHSDAEALNRLGAPPRAGSD
jgi:hypothetical protein